MKVVEMRTSKNGITCTEDANYALTVDNCGDEGLLNLPPNTRLACCLIPIPKGYRLLTEDEKRKYKKEDLWKHIKFKSSLDRVDFDSFDNEPEYKLWCVGILYVIREDWTPEPKIEITVTINGKAVDPSTISEETWNKLRNGGVE